MQLGFHCENRSAITVCKHQCQPLYFRMRSNEPQMQDAASLLAFSKWVPVAVYQRFDNNWTVHIRFSQVIHPKWASCTGNPINLAISPMNKCWNDLCLCCTPTTLEPILVDTIVDRAVPARGLVECLVPFFSRKWIVRMKPEDRMVLSSKILFALLSFSRWNVLSFRQSCQRSRG